jgi:predicted phage terminase large subunit-like protein
VQPLIHERLEFPELVRAGTAQVQRWPAAEHIVEGKASGKSLRQQLRASGIPLIEVPTLGDKVARANSITKYFEAGMVYFVLGPGMDVLET